MTKSLNKAVWRLCAITVDTFQVFKAYERHNPPSIVILWYINALMWHLAIAVSLMQKRLAATEHWCMKLFWSYCHFWMTMTVVKEELLWHPCICQTEYSAWKLFLESWRRYKTEWEATDRHSYLNMEEMECFSVKLSFSPNIWVQIHE